MNDFERIYREYFQYVFFYILQLCRNREIAEEVTQETFFTALNTKAKFQNQSDIRTWLCQIAKNKYLTLLRKKKFILEDTEIDQIEDARDFRIDLEDRDTAMEIHRCLHLLEDPYKEVFSLRVLGELSFRDIAHVFGKSDAWARVTYSRAKLKLIERMNCHENGL
ncbi:MAG: sigma-70 family RNA polymerase sigma factor [Lachnospiraceae bacterium]|nr:sigma-70 family RNA polymerase sigma factor [Lachnospiraceae bacterium]